MIRNSAKVLSDALSLPPRSRAKLVEQLLESLDDPKQKEIDRGNQAGGKRKSAMSPAQPEREKPVEKKVRADGEKAHHHRRVAFADRIKRWR